MRLVWALGNPMSRSTYNIYDILDKVRKRPGMYIGDEKLENMRSYLAGYQMAMMDLNLEDTAEPSFYEFHEWIRNRFNYYESTAGWCNMIFAVVLGFDPENIRWENYQKDATTEQHRESIREFYRLLDEYRESNA